MEITGSGVFGSNSAELAPVEPDRAGRLDDDALQPEAQAEDRQPPLAGVGDGADLALDAANAEAAGNQHTVHIVQRGGGAGFGLAVVGCHPAHLDLGTVLEAAGP